MALKDIDVRKLTPADRIYKRADERGLYIEVRPTGARLWRLKYRFAGREKKISFGPYPEVGLAEARQRRDDARRQLRDGVDPGAERRRQKLLAKFNAANSFGDVGTEFINKMVAEGRADTTTEKARWLLAQMRPLASLPLADLKPMEVLAALKRIEAKGNHETARRCRSLASRIFRYGVATGRADADPTVALRSALIVPRVRHHGALIDPDAVGDLLRTIDAYSGQRVTRLAMQIAPHVMARPGELRLATWTEFDLEQHVWKVPAERMKMRRPHIVPLSRQVLTYLEELRALTGPTGFVFPAFHTWRRPISENTINQAFRRMGYRSGEVTAHGLRTTASTLLHESGRFESEVIERSLAHADTNVIRGIYNRAAYWNERVAMHQWWSDHLDALRKNRKPGDRPQS